MTVSVKNFGLTPERVEEILGAPFATTAHSCHSVSLAIVKAQVLPDGARVARGTCRGVGSQHSWITIGDPYRLGVPIIDATLWSYDDTVTGIWFGASTAAAGYGRHIPHGGHGSIWTYGKPAATTTDYVELKPRKPLTREAKGFLDMLGKLDRRAWMLLADAPVLGWPAAEIIEAMYDTPELRALVPIDRVGMLTDRNPSGLYLPGDEVE